jgi:(2Fe-2S) ferredoxin
MKKPTYHIFICTSSRMAGDPKGVCQKKGGSALIQYLDEGIQSRGIENVMVTNTGCFKLCDRGPVMVIYGAAAPQGHWYADLTEEKVDEILDALEGGQPAEHLLLA